MGEQEGQADPEDKVCKGRRHKIPHGTRTPQDAVQQNLDGWDDIKRRDNQDKQYAGLQRAGGVILQKQADQRAAQQDKQRCKGEAREDGDADAAFRPLADAVQLSGPDVLRRKIGHCRAQGAEASDGEVIELDGGGVGGDDRRAKAVDQPLDEDIADRDKALLQCAGDGDAGDSQQDGAGE